MDETVLLEVMGVCKEMVRMMAWCSVQSANAVCPLLQPVFVTEREPERNTNTIKLYHIIVVCDGQQHS